MENKNLFDLDGKVAVVTGSTRGIGRAIATALSQCGAKVVISSRKSVACEEVAHSIREMGGEALAVPCNVSSTQQLKELVNRCLDRWKRIDILVCNAAANPYFGSMSEASDSAYDTVMDTNVRQVMGLCHLVIPQMVAQQGGSIIIVSSIGGLKGHQNLGLYAISKAAEMQLARNLAVEWGKKNITVNCIAPGLVKTDFAKALWEDPVILEKALQFYPLGRIGQPEDVAGAAVFLASPAGSFVTGQVIVVEGGATIAMGN